MATAVMLDIDGVLTVSWRALPGAVDTVRWLEDHRYPVRYVTNTSSKSRREIAGLLAGAGLPVDESVILTAVTGAARYLHDHYPDTPCLVVNEGDLHDDLEGVQLTGVDQADAPAGVVLLGGAGPSTGYTEFNSAFVLATEGVPLVALHRNTRYQTSDGLALDMGAFLVGLEAASGATVIVVGKPAVAFYQAALDDLGAPPETTVMVGDDIGSDVLGAQALGITGVLVRTGKFRPDDLTDSGPQPDHVIDSIADLPHLLEQIDAVG